MDTSEHKPSIDQPEGAVPSPGPRSRDGTDPAKGSPAKGAHRIGDDGGDKAGRADPGFAMNGE